MQLRELPPDEWYKLATIPPFDAGLPDPTHWRILCVEEAGQIVGVCGASNQVHWDPFWVHPNHQGKSAVFRHLLRAGIRLFQEAGVPGVHITVPNDQPELQALVQHFGFVEAPGKLYLLAVPELQEVH
jgi:hypothetical protein